MFDRALVTLQGACSRIEKVSNNGVVQRMYMYMPDGGRWMVLMNGKHKYWFYLQGKEKKRSRYSTVERVSAEQIINEFK